MFAMAHDAMTEMSQWLPGAHGHLIAKLQEINEKLLTILCSDGITCGPVAVYGQ